MKRHIIILLLMGLMPIHLMARTISREEAANFALQFLSDGESEPELAPMLLNTNEEDLFAEEGHEYMYLVQTIDDGWVVMSTDDRFPPILAKGDGIFYPFHDSIPPAMRELLNGYIREMKYVIDSTNYTATHLEWVQFENGTLGFGHILGSNLYTPGEKLLNKPTENPNLNIGKVKWNIGEVKWNQQMSYDKKIDPCYNKFCPNGWLESNQDKKCPAGCVAVAMAQVMWYWEWPHTAYIPTEINRFGVTNDVTEFRLYEWENMPPKISDTTKLEHIDAVAILIRDCGYAAKTKYSVDGSTSTIYKAKTAFDQTFYYNDESEVLLRMFNRRSWTDKIRNEINARRPVIYGAGASESLGGHAFVVDGYHANDSNLFHINWGWGKGNDHFVRLESLKASSSNDTDSTEFDMFHIALFGLQPNPTCTPQSVSSDVSTGEIYRMGTGDTITVSNSVIEPNSRTIYFSGTGIRITPGFHAKSGSNVTMQIRYFHCDYIANVSVQAMPRKPKEDVVEHKVEQNDQFSWSVSPNPVTSHLRVNADKDIRAIELYSIDGRRYEWREDKEINVSSLPNGMYLLRVHCMDNEILQTKIIKQ